MDFEEIKKTEFVKVISNFDRLSYPLRNSNNIGNIINEARNGPAEHMSGKTKKW